MRFIGFIGAVAFALVAVACGQTDTGITTNIKTKLAADDTVKATEINVTTREHVVTLTGNVETQAAEARALEIARTADGVRDVIDQIEVRDTAATTGELDRDDDGLDAVGDDIKRGAEATGNAIKKGAEATANAARKAGTTARDAVTDENRDSDRDGK